MMKEFEAQLEMGQKIPVRKAPTPASDLKRGFLAGGLSKGPTKGEIKHPGPGEFGGYPPKAPIVAPENQGTWVQLSDDIGVTVRKTEAEMYYNKFKNMSPEQQLMYYIMNPDPEGPPSPVQQIQP